MFRSWREAWRRERIRVEWMVRRRYGRLTHRGLYLVATVFISWMLFIGHISLGVDFTRGETIIEQSLGSIGEKERGNFGPALRQSVKGLWMAFEAAYDVGSSAILRHMASSGMEDGGDPGSVDSIRLWPQSSGGDRPPVDDIVPVDDRRLFDVDGKDQLDLDAATEPDRDGEVMKPEHRPFIDDPTDTVDVLSRMIWGDDPLVFIFHSHTSESYRSIPEDPAVDGDFHLMNETDTGITRVGRAISKRLESLGIPVIHSKKVHNYPHHWEAYVNSRKTVAGTLEQYPSIQIVLDVHRQGIPDAVWSTRVGDTDAVKVEIIYTTASDMTFGDHVDWKRNERFAFRLADAMDQVHPGLLFKVTEVSTKRYNQDLFGRMLLLEIGNYLDLEEDAIRAGGLVADAVAVVLRDMLADPSESDLRTTPSPVNPVPRHPLSTRP